MVKVRYVLLILLLLILPIASAERIYPIGEPTITQDFEGWDYGIDYHYKAHFKNQLNSGYAYDFNYQNTNLQFDYSTLRYRGDTRVQNIDNPTNSRATLNNNQLTYPDVYGQGISLRITPQKTMIKEEIIIENFNDLPSLNANMRNDGTTYLEVNVKTKINSRHIRVNGQEWDNVTERNTPQDIIIYDSQGKELFKLLKPIAKDSQGAEVSGFYVIKNSANTVQLDVRFPYSFFETATYPVTIDPTINATINATTPSLYLFRGKNNQYPYYNFYNYTDITPQISDDNSATKFITYVGTSPYIDILLGYSFNQLSYQTFVHEYTDKHDAVITGTIKPVRYQDSYYGAYFDGNSYLTVINTTGIDIPDLANQTACVLFNRSTINSGNEYLYSNYGSTGINLYLKNDGKLNCQYYGTTGNDQAESSAVNVRDNNLHLACCRKYEDTLELWVDGVMRAQKVKNYGEINSIHPLKIMSNNIGENRFVGTVKQFGIVNRKVPDDIMAWINNYDGLGTKTIANISQGSSIQAYFNHSAEMDENYFLELDLTLTGVSTIKVIPYINETHPNTSNSKDFTVSNGVNYLSINDLLYEGYNLPFRIYDILGVANNVINDVYLFETINDTEPPVIENCTYTPSNISCEELSNITCTITDNQGIQEVKYLINHEWDETNNVVNPNKNGNEYYYLDEHILTFNGTRTITFEQANATDLLGLTTTIYPNLSITYTCLDPSYFINISHSSTPTHQINLTTTSVVLYWATNNQSNSTVNYGLESYNLNLTVSNTDLVYEHYVEITDLTPSTNYYYTLTSAFNPSQTSEIYGFTTLGTCTENWVNNPINTSTCEYNNTIAQIINYVDSNDCGTYDNLPIDNGTNTIGYCNYCTPNWVLLTGEEYECKSNSTRYIDYIDYNTCYLQTGLLEDAPPSDYQTWTSCTYYISDFNCTIAEQPYLKDKMEYSCILPNSINDYDCINSVTYGLTDILQVNPQKQERTDSFISLNNKIETRDTFVTNNGLLNAYFTNKNLVSETPFTITTTCSNGNSTLVHQKTITPTYKNIDEVPTYALWVKTNAGYLVIGFIMVLILIWLTAFLIKEAKYR